MAKSTSDEPLIPDLPVPENVIAAEINNQEIDEYNREWVPDVIVLGPGGAKAYMELGALLKIESMGYFRNIRHWIGCSAGAAIALLIVAGYTVTEIIRETLDIDILKDITDLLNNITGLESLINILEKKGLFSNQQVEMHIRKKVKQKFGTVPTLKQLYMATGLDLNIVTYNTDLQRVEYLSKDSEPNLSCVQAAMMSMAVPLLMQCRVYKGHEYIDGAVGNPYPIDIYDNGENRILGIYVLSNIHDPEKTSKLKYLYRVGHASINQLREQNIKYASNKCKHLELVSTLLDTTGITFSNKNKEELMRIGYHKAKEFLDKLNHPNKYKLLIDEDEEIPFGDESVLDTEANEILGQLLLNNNNEDPDINNSDNIITIPLTSRLKNIIDDRMARK